VIYLLPLTEAELGKREGAGRGVTGLDGQYSVSMSGNREFEMLDKVQTICRRKKCAACSYHMHCPETFVNAVVAQAVSLERSRRK